MSETGSMARPGAGWLVAGLALTGAAVWAWRASLLADLRRYLKIRSM